MISQIIFKLIIYITSHPELVEGYSMLKRQVTIRQRRIKT